MGRLTPQPPPNDRVNSLTRWPAKPVFQPNRVIRKGEPICEVCGFGWSTHIAGTRAHTYQGRRPFAVVVRTAILRWLSL